MQKIASCDSQGSVYLANDAVYRFISEKEIDSVKKVLEILNNEDQLGIVDTRIEENPGLIINNESSNSSLILKHYKVEFISYPHEWCASMLKDAALYHLWLSVKLDNINLYLKDAHPWNLLFDNGRFLFIDYTSIVNMELLFAEDYLVASRQYSSSNEVIRLEKVILEIFSRMFFPYFFIPLYAYSCKPRQMIADRILETTLNTSSEVMLFNEFSPKLHFSTRYIRLVLEYFKIKCRLYMVKWKFSKDHDPVGYFEGLIKIINKIYVSNQQSAYADYYQAKKEDSKLEQMESWNNKQKNVFKFLENSKYRSVLDIACNTGWYSQLAASLGKRVIAIDSDHSCIEILYSKVKEQKLDILPLVVDFTDLQACRNSTIDGNPVLLPVEERLDCDTVLALGIFHHLVLGQGLDLHQAVRQLILFCKKQLILEFIGLDDERIREDPAFFPAYHANPSAFKDYNLNTMLTVLSEHFTSIETVASYPNSRMLIVCNK